MYNDEKSIFCTSKLSILGYVIENGDIKPDPGRLRPLRDLPIPQNTKELSMYDGHAIDKRSCKCIQPDEKSH